LPLSARPSDDAGVDGDDERSGTAKTLPAPALRRARPRVLIVEDDELLASALRRVLGDAFELTIAIHGAAALRLIEEPGRELDFVVSDVRMPWMNGIDLHRSLVARGHPLARRFVWMTGDLDLSPAHQTYVDQTGLGLLLKPFPIDELERRIEASYARDAHASGAHARSR
jgi:DNA-binding response OmpR family regulator